MVERQGAYMPRAQRSGFWPACADLRYAKEFAKLREHFGEDRNVEDHSR
jgi:hypothetical protein